MNVAVLLFLFLAACSASISSQSQSQPTVAGPSIVGDQKEEQRAQPKGEEKAPGIGRQLDEANRRVDYLRRYLGPEK